MKVRRLSPAGRLAQRRGLRPIFANTYNPQLPKAFVASLPELGDYIPEGWIAVNGITDYLVNTNGGRKNGILSIEAFNGIVQQYAHSTDPFAFGIVDRIGTDILIRVYRPDPRDFTRSGNLTNRELDSLGDPRLYR